MKHAICLFFVCLGALFGFGEQDAGNLFVNPRFISSDGHQPDGWIGFRDAKAIVAYTTEGGVLSIDGTTATYANWIGQQVAVDPTKGYFFEVEMKADALSGPVSIVYSVIDDSKKKIVADRPLVKNFHGPLKDWTRFSAVIAMPTEGTPKYLSVSFIRYNPSRRAGAADKVSFRRPKLEVYTGQTPVALPRIASSSAKAMPGNPFPENFTGRPVGSEYSLEKGGLGFFRFNTALMPRQPVTVEMEAPDGFEAELYLQKRGATALGKVDSPTGRRWEVSADYDWLIWGNGLVFKAPAAAAVGEILDVRLSFACGGKRAVYRLPVRLVEGPGETRLPKTRRFNSWQSFPITRIDVSKPENRLARELSDYWHRAGWRHTPFVEIGKVLPARLTAATRHLAAGEDRLADVGLDANGNPSENWCERDWAERGSEHFAAVLRRTGLAEKLAAADYAMWDFEPYCSGPVTASCFCEKCRAAFAKSNGLAAALSGREIIAKHRSAWVKFRCRQRAEMVRVTVAAVKAVNPRIRFQFCSMPGDPGTEPDWMLKYGIELPLYEDFTDIFTTMNYSGSRSFFGSLEDERKRLRKENRMFVSNGWGHPEPAGRVAMQLVAEFFAGIDYPFLGQGLYVSDGAQLAAIRGAMDFLARTEGEWQDAAYNPDKLRVEPGFRGDQIHTLERLGRDGTRYLTVFNNSDRETGFARVQIPGEDPLTVSVGPRGWRYFRLDAAGAESRRAASRRADEAESAAKEEYARNFAVHSENGMRTEATPDFFTVRTPVQLLKFDLHGNGTAAWWKTEGKSRLLADKIGCDFFTTDNMFIEPGTGEATVETSEIAADRVSVTVSYAIAKAPYDGLRVRRVYTVPRDEPEVKVSVEVVPEGGYRMFRLRTGANLHLSALPATPSDPASVYACGGVKDTGLKHIAFVREGARFPGGEPFFVGRYAKAALPLEGNVCRVGDVLDRSGFICAAADPPDEIFGWRDRGTASVEFIFPDAYDHYDPHAVKTWKTEYSFKYMKPNKE